MSVTLVRSIFICLIASYFFFLMFSTNVSYRAILACLAHRANTAKKATRATEENVAKGSVPSIQLGAAVTAPKTDGN